MTSAAATALLETPYQKDMVIVTDFLLEEQSPGVFC